jgi:serine protease Do
MRLQAALLAVVIVVVGRSNGQSSADEQIALEAAVRRASAVVAPSVARIETTGGLEATEGVRRGSGAATGVVVGGDGWIISSAYNLAHKPAGVFVTLATGERKPARVVGVDHPRQLALLKIEASNLPTPIPAPRKEIRAGQWAIALGRAWEATGPSIAVGIISSAERFGGKAIQTDAKVSPINYGGPLIDLEGRAFGVLVPLSPHGDSLAAGVEWHDSGIGFAVPLEDVLRAAPRLAQGDLRRGLIGVRLADDESGEATLQIAQVAWRSPAERAGLQKGDRIVAVDGAALSTPLDFHRAMDAHYAGDAVEMRTRRGANEVTHTLTMIETLPAYRRPFLGVLPVNVEGKGIGVRRVYPDSPAAKAGLAANDIIVAVDKRPVLSDRDLEQSLDAHAPKESVAVTVERGERSEEYSIELTTFPEAIPRDAAAPGEEDEPKPARIDEIAAADGSWWGAIPTDLATKASVGVVLIAADPERITKDGLVRSWSSTLRDRQLALVGMGTPGRGREALDALADAIEEIGRRRPVDRARVIVCGVGPWGVEAERWTRKRRELVRGLVAIGAGELRGLGAHPAEKLACLVYVPAVDPRLSELTQRAERLRADGTPALVRPTLRPGPTLFSALLVDEIGRWSELIGAR